MVDVEGAFLQGKFTDGDVLHMEVMDGMTQYYYHDERADTVLLLNVLLYGAKQVTHYFYAALVEAIKKREYARSKAGPCTYYLTVDGQLALMVLWIDDLILLGPQQIVDLMKNDLSDASV